MRTKKYIDYSGISKRSMRIEVKDDNLYTEKEKLRNTRNLSKITGDKIIYVGEGSSYFQYRRFLLGKLVRVVGESCIGAKKYQFINDDDRISLNNAAGWSNMKNEYIFDNIKLASHAR